MNPESDADTAWIEQEILKGLDSPEREITRADWDSLRRRVAERGRSIRSICVFCGSHPGLRSEYAAAAEEVGRALAERGIRLVYGAGRVGLMGLLADAALAAGGQVIGVIPQMMVEREWAHRELTELRIVGSMHERKALMAELSDGFLALPGGLGTFEELCEVLTWGQLGIHNKPCGCLNVLGYFDGLQGQLDHAVAEGFLGPEQRRLLITCSNVMELLDRLSEQMLPANSRFGREAI